MLARSRWSIVPILTLTALASPSPASAQNTFNPYGNSGYADYREFATPMYSNDPSLPGQARLQGQGIGGRTRANQFEAYSNSINGLDTEAAAGTRNGRPAAGAGVPYFQASRQYDEQYRQVYKPNDSEANRKYVERMKRRDEAYAKVLAERDPAKRARLIRQFEQVSVDRPAPPAARPAAGPPAPTRTPTTRAPAPPAVRSPALPGASASTAPTRAAGPGMAAPAGTPAPGLPPASNPSSIPIPPPR